MKFALVLCGGTGSRLWPLSTPHTPKQFIKFINNQTLLEATIERIPKDFNIIFVSSKRYVHKLSGFKNKYDIIAEPFKKNTAPAIITSIQHIYNKHKNIPKNEIQIIVIPSDHCFDHNKFQEVLQIGLDKIIDNNIVTFGIKPLYPETEFGYIKYNENENDIECFIEKPDFVTAKKLINENYLWNSGVFMFNLETILEEFKNHQPNMLNLASFCLEYSKTSDNIIELHDIYNEFEDLSFDYAIMEKTNSGKVIKYDGYWNDMGSWNRIYDMTEKDKDGNIIDGNIIHKDTKNSFIKTDKGIITTLGLDNMVVVKNKDDILVINKDRCKDIKIFNEQLQIYHKKNKNFRPWGNYECLDGGIDKGYQVKKITVYPGKRLSLQYHHKRSEHWIITKGHALVQVGDDLHQFKKNQSVYIPVGVKHRITNIGNIDVEFIETQIGNYLGEDDIVRLEDDFGRK